MAKGFVPVKSTKVFSGKKFELIGSHPSKILANNLKAQCQTEGYLVRLVKRQSPEARKNPNDKYSRSGVIWCIYIRRV